MQINFESVSGSGDEDEACVTEIRLDLSSGKATLRRVADVHCEFPTIPDSLVGAQPRLYRYFPDVCMWGSLLLNDLRRPPLHCNSTIVPDVLVVLLLFSGDSS